MQMTAKPASTVRIQALDFTKGALVLIMVFYHWLNYFIGTNLDYRYLRFLTPSFIFITGFLISHVYLSRHKASDPGVAKRLLTRGVKLLLIFLALNVAREILMSRSSSGAMMLYQLSFSNLWEIFVVGDVPIAAGKVVAFSILIPIGYVLILSAGLLFLYKHFKYTFHVTLALFLICIATQSLRGSRSPNLELMAIGLVGILVGFISEPALKRFVTRPYLFLVSYVVYLVTISVWNVPFVLLVVGVCLTLWGMYLLGLNDSAPGWVRRRTIVLGRHSLFGYIVQIAILQALSAVLRQVDSRAAVIGVSFIGAFALTVAAVEVVEYAMKRSIIAGRLYKVAFA
jgi:hypothetical protein